MTNLTRTPHPQRRWGIDDGLGDDGNIAIETAWEFHDRGSHQAAIDHFDVAFNYYLKANDRARVAAIGADSIARRCYDAAACAFVALGDRDRLERLQSLVRREEVPSHVRAEVERLTKMLLKR